MVLQICEGCEGMEMAAQRNDCTALILGGGSDDSGIEISLEGWFVGIVDERHVF